MRGFDRFNEVVSAADAGLSGSSIAAGGMAAGTAAGMVSGVGGESAMAERWPRRAGERREIPPKLYRIGEVVDYSGLSRQTIHNYTTMGLLPPSRWTRGGHRLYDESVFARLDHIERLKQSHKSMEEIRRHFAQADSAGG